MNTVLYSGKLYTCQTLNTLILHVFFLYIQYIIVMTEFLLPGTEILLSMITDTHCKLICLAAKSIG